MMLKLISHHAKKRCFTPAASTSLVSNAKMSKSLKLPIVD